MPGPIGPVPTLPIPMTQEQVDYLLRLELLGGVTSPSFVSLLPVLKKARQEFEHPPLTVDEAMALMEKFGLGEGGPPNSSAVIRALIAASKGERA